MKGFIKTVALAFVTGMACQAGIQVWNNILSEKANTVATNLKTAFKKKES